MPKLHLTLMLAMLSSAAGAGGAAAVLKSKIDETAAKVITLENDHDSERMDTALRLQRLEDGLNRLERHFGTHP